MSREGHDPSYVTPSDVMKSGYRRGKQQTLLGVRAFALELLASLTPYQDPRGLEQIVRYCEDAFRAERDNRQSENEGTVGPTAT